MSKTYMEGKMKMDKSDLNDRVNDKGWNQKNLHLLLSFSYFLNIKKNYVKRAPHPFFPDTRKR